MAGSENNDLILDEKGTTATNHAGGMNGGITNGNELVVRVAVKPTSSIGKNQKTFNLEAGEVKDRVLKVDMMCVLLFVSRLLWRLRWPLHLPIFIWK